MKKRTVFTVIGLACLLMIVIVGGVVFAQGDLTSSSAGGEKAPVTSGEEAAPNSVAQAGGEVVHSTVDGNAPSAISVDTDESTFHFTTIDGQLPSSNSPINIDDKNSPYKIEPMMTLSESQPDAPTYNASLRYVGNTLKPRANTVNYAVSGDGGCVHITGGDAWEVWDLPLALPNGVKVEYLRMYYYDNDAGVTMYGWFTKYNLYGDIVQEWPVTSVTTGYNYSDVTITPAETINYNSYSYVINWRPIGANTNLRLCGFRIFYTQYTALFLPFLNKP